MFKLRNTFLCGSNSVNLTPDNDLVLRRFLRLTPVSGTTNLVGLTTVVLLDVFNGTATIEPALC